METKGTVFVQFGGQNLDAQQWKLSVLEKLSNCVQESRTSNSVGCWLFLVLKRKPAQANKKNRKRKHSVCFVQHSTTDTKTWRYWKIEWLEQNEQNEDVDLASRLIRSTVDTVGTKLWHCFSKRRRKTTAIWSTNKHKYDIKSTFADFSISTTTSNCQTSRRAVCGSTSSASDCEWEKVTKEVKWGESEQTQQVAIHMNHIWKLAKQILYAYVLGNKPMNTTMAKRHCQHSDKTFQIWKLKFIAHAIECGECDRIDYKTNGSISQLTRFMRFMRFKGKRHHKLSRHTTNYRRTVILHLIIIVTPVSTKKSAKMQTYLDAKQKNVNSTRQTCDFGPSNRVPRCRLLLSVFF